MFGRLKKKVRVYIQDGPTIEGTLAGKTRDAYIIWAPRIVPEPTEYVEQPEPVQVSGHVEIPKKRVLWYQVIG